MADQQTPYGMGLLDAYGLPKVGTRDELERERIKQNFRMGAANAQLSGDMPAYFQQMQQLGGALSGAAFGERPSEEEYARVDAVQAAQRRMQNRGLSVSTDEKLEGEGAAAQFQSFLAEELMKRGDYNTATQMMNDLTQRQKAQEARDIALRQAGLNADNTQWEAANRQIDAAKKKLGLTDVYTADGKMATMRIDERGYAIDDLTGTEYPPGSYSTNPKVVELMMAQGVQSTDLLDPKLLTPNQRIKFYSDDEQKDFRDKQRLIYKQMDEIKSLKTLLDEDFENNKGLGLTLIGPTGDVLGAANKVVDTLMGIGTAVGAAFGAEGDTPVTVGVEEGNKTTADLHKMENAKKFAEEHPEMMARVRKVVEKYGHLPKSMTKGGTLAAQWEAQLVRMAYAQARASEPSNRGLSNQDFENALKALAANTTSPEAMRRVLLSNLKSNFDDFDRRWKAYGGLQPIVFTSRDLYTNFKDDYENFRKELDPQNWGYSPAEFRPDGEELAGPSAAMRGDDGKTKAPRRWHRNPDGTTSYR